MRKIIDITTLLVCFVLSTGLLRAQVPADTIRYVKTSGDYANDGKSWATAKNNIQDAINSLYEYLQDNHLTSGSIYVAAGVYKPTESTESASGGLQHTSFKVYPGIHIYGGFPADITENNCNPYALNGAGTDYLYRPHNTMSDLESGGESTEPGKLQPWNFVNKTILSGAHTTEPTFTYNAAKGTYSTLFSGNSYHVVWFATEGRVPIKAGEGEDALGNHYLPLSSPASVDGCVITGGYAASRSDTLHSSYGGGVYMVAGATLSNCEVHHCEATLRGGGVYLDGGGLVDKCMVHTCQSLGIGISEGYGGGVCIRYDGAVTRSYILNNVGRAGGGVIIFHAPNDYPYKSLDAYREANGGEARGEINVYSPHATACIISYNNATAEGAGIYFYDGGVGNHLTVTRNKCFGTDVILYGRRQGRSGGVYILNGGHLYNSVIWGNRCPANNDIQYAAYIGGSTADVVNPETGEVIREGLKPVFHNSAVEKHDISDWAGTAKRNAMSLESSNINTAANNANYPYFIGYDGKGGLLGLIGAGFNSTLAMGTIDENYDPEAASSDLSVNPHNVPDHAKTGLPRPIYWKPAAISSMAKMGLQVTDALNLTSRWVLHAHTDTDLFGDFYEPMSTFGALVRREELFKCVLFTNQEQALYEDNGYTQAKINAYNTAVGDPSFLPVVRPAAGPATIPTLFVDPARNAGQKGILIGDTEIGISWDKPVGSINDAIYFFRQHLKKNDDGTTYYDGSDNAHYLFDLNGDGDYDDEGEGDFTAVQILVKGYDRGSGMNATTAGKDAYIGSQLRTAAVRPCSNMRIYGSFAPAATGTDTRGRDSRANPTIITANITKSGYENNSAHVMALINVRNVIIDGVRLYEGNANLNAEHSYAPIDPATGKPYSIAYGGGLMLNNRSVPQAVRIDMTGNIFRNGYIANCSAPDGAAVYVNSSNKKANNEYSEAELHIFNTVIRNNSVRDGSTTGDGGVVTAVGGKAKIRLDHCDLVNNCGYALETLEYTDKETPGAATTVNADEGQIRIYNSVIYANGRKIYSNRKRIVQPLSCRSSSGSSGNVAGDYIYLDWDAPKPSNPAHCYPTLCRDFSEHYGKWGIRLKDAMQMTYIKDGVAQVFFFDTQEEAESHRSANAAPSGYEWTEPIHLEYPYFDNPSKNSGHSETGDVPINGGIVSYVPGNMNPMVNAAVPASKALWDISRIVRSYGGDPDIGAIENTNLPKDGTVLYVTPDGAGRRDGSSWANAIQGNAIYAMNDAAAAGTDALDETNGTTRIINTTEDGSATIGAGNGVLTTDNRYQGGFAKIYLTASTGNPSVTTITKTWTTEKNVYDDGPNEGLEESIQDNVLSTATTTVPGASGNTVGFTAGWYDDVRYPYGEISGQSRSFWRATGNRSPLDESGKYNQDIPSGNRNIDWLVDNDSLVIKNARTENYVSGLQYAVEMASLANKTNHNTVVQVWVGAGKYTDYKGYIMRDSTTVMGGFPVNKYGTPGLTERQALMSAVVAIPKSSFVADYDAEDYETLLQISDVNPKLNDSTFNTAAANFFDDDYKRTLLADTTKYVYKNRTIEHHYIYNTTPTESEVTSSYISNYNFTETTKSAKVTEEERYSYTFGNTYPGMDVWHISYPQDCKVKESEFFSSNISRRTYDHSTGTEITPVTSLKWLWPHDAELTGMETWQTIPSLPSGEYRFEIDLGASYRNAVTDATSLNMNLLIIDADNDTTIQPISSSGSLGGAGTDGRGVAYRYTINFSTSTTGALTIKIVVGEGMRSNSGNIADGTSSPNRREFWMSNLKLYCVTAANTYVLNPEEEVDNLEDNTTEPHEPDVITDNTTYTSSKDRLSLRKRVLSSPDICTPTYFSAPNDPTGEGNDDLAHTVRVKTGDLKSRGTNKLHPDTNYVAYNEVYWNGFTIRHGFLYEISTAHGGGSGVAMFDGVHLQNCIITDNISVGRKMKGGGVYCEGPTSTIENCFILNNSTTCKVGNDNRAQEFAGGLFLYEGTCFNSLIANNYCYGFGSVGLCVGRFYNNTVAYNRAFFTNSNSGYKPVGGVRMAVKAGNELLMANSIIYGNTGLAVDITSGGDKVAPFINCYVQSASQITKSNFLQALANYEAGNPSTNKNYGTGNIFLNDTQVSAANTPFAADLDGVTYVGNAKTQNNFALRISEETAKCVNYGTEDFEEAMDYCLSAPSSGLSDALKTAYRNAVDGVSLPMNDVAFARRVQDCQVDMGAYEYDGTKEIKPGYELIAFDPERPDERELCAVYYVAEQGEGLATADSPVNAACAEKLQKVLDAAGRYRADHFLRYDPSAPDDLKLGAGEHHFTLDLVQLDGTVTPTYEEVYFDGDVRKVRTMTAPDTDLSTLKHVIVKLAEGTFHPVRSTDNSMVEGHSEEVLPTRSFNVPHGVELWGGYVDNPDAEGDFMETYRDPLNHKTTLDGLVADKLTGSNGRAYHVVSFTNNIYGTDDLLWGEDSLRLIGLPDSERAILDGISIESGQANGTDTEDRVGAAAVVTEYAHVRNCILQGNEAQLYGGALYLKPASLVSGSVVLNNTAELGGAIYVEEPDNLPSDEDERDLLYARVYNSTIVRNTASTRGGGIWYENNIRAKGLVLWQNSSNDMNNVAGTFDTEKDLTENNYPFAYTAVQARRLPGVNNIAIQPENSKDARFSQNSVSDMRWRGDTQFYTGQTNKEAYYYLEKLSALVRSGMPYALYNTLRTKYPSLELRDMAGVARMAEHYDPEGDNSVTDERGFKNYQYLKHMTLDPLPKQNDFIEMGARALNAEMRPKLKRPFTRLFVANPQYVDNEIATRLLECDDPLYSQPGSSMANPFQKFSDALDYIISLRSSTEKVNGVELREIYRDTRFEIFIAGGTYYPTHNARGVEGHARASTFIVPEGVSITGGLSPEVFYCQDGYNFNFLQQMADNNVLNIVYNEGKYEEYEEDPTFAARYGVTGEQITAVPNSNARTKIMNEDGEDLNVAAEGREALGITLVPALTDDIWSNRPRSDINGNNIYEPWEFLYVTTFSGETPRGIENTDNVYHIFTCYADPNHLGALPHRYSAYTADGTTGHPHIKYTGQLDHHTSGTEHPNSELHRMIIFNGVEITGGNARDYDDAAIKNRTNFYRGGGIFVDGNWEDGDQDSGKDKDGNTIDGYDSSDPDAKGLRDIPLMILSSQFTDNNAIQGGAIFSNGSLTILGCSFGKNYAQGPTDEPAMGDLTGVVQYTGGGAIAANGMVRCANTIFANNEAAFGTKSLGPGSKGYMKQGFGGAIWGGKKSELRFTNCDIVNNKGVSYPAVFVDHTDYDNMFCANTIYWGNRASGSEDTDVTFSGDWSSFKPADLNNIQEGEMDINRDVFSYRTAVQKQRELALMAKKEAGTITSSEETELAALQSHQVMFFCCYRPTFGPEPIASPGKVTISGRDSFYGTIVNGTFDPHEVPFLGEEVNYFTIFQGNNNVGVNPVNDHVDGPNFVMPSPKAGRDGYTPSANWMPSRINNLTDNGWSYLTLVEGDGGKTEFKKSGDVKPENALLPDNAVSGGPYNFYALMFRNQYNLTFMPFGDQFYMQYATAGMSEEESRMLRISSNPLLLKAEEKAYIDLGVYEYQHRSLRINQTGEIDVIWVAERENIENGNDGYTWDAPTSNLQAAIETLLRSRNGHAKQVNIIGGEYKPTALLGEGDDMSQSFTIQTKLMNNGALTPVTGKEFGVDSLTIRGGYDPTIPGEAGYNPEKNPVVLSMAKRTSTTDDQLNHIFNIIDVEQYSTSITIEGSTKYHKGVGHAIPIIFEGLTFENTFAGAIDIDSKNKGGAAIYYGKQTKWNESDGEKSDDLLLPPAVYKDITDDATDNPTWVQTDKPKLTIRNCIFRQNGKNVANPTSAVKVEEGGGHTLIVNCLFDHNAGNPLEAINANVLNCTFGLNGGHLTLTESVENSTTYHSSLHNSVIYRDDKIHDETTQWSIKNSSDAEIWVPSTYTLSDSCTYNAYTDIDSDPATLAEDAKLNMHISKVNGDMLLGPNFVDPDNGDFHLSPSKALMNTGSDAKYAQLVWPQYYGTTTDAINAYTALMQNLHNDQKTVTKCTTNVWTGTDMIEIYYDKYAAHMDYDLGTTARLQSQCIDRGAYECASKGLRIIYVNPNVAVATGNENGRDWSKAYGQGKLQRAIDAASIYTTNPSNGGKHAYVFVKGSSIPEGTITLREGVEVYGSLPNTFAAIAIPENSAEEEWTYTDAEVDAYVNRVKAERRGIAEEGSTPSIIRGIQTISVMSHDQPLVVDGFQITNGATTSEPAATPAVDISVRNVTLRNNIFTGNVMAEHVPVVKLKGSSSSTGSSLLYNSLVYANKADTLVSVGSNGYVLNTTIVADNAGEVTTGLPASEDTDGKKAAFRAAHIQNSIEVNESAGRATTFAPYFRPKDKGNAYELPEYLSDHRPYWYQLHELSADINAGNDDNGAGDGNTVQDGGNTIAKHFTLYVNFAHDRDLLGNPRRLGGRLDNGCFETWCITGNSSATNVTNGKASSDLNKFVLDLEEVAEVTDPGDGGTEEEKTAYQNYVRYKTYIDAHAGHYIAKDVFWTTNYGGHHYPHPGSVVYVMNGGNLVFNTDGGDAPLFTNASPVRPGYVLLKPGGAIYGQGNVLQFSYVAAEKPFGNGTKYGLVSMPFDVNLDATATFTFTAGTHSLTPTDKHEAFSAYTYDASARAEYNYIFKTTESGLWQTGIDAIKNEQGQVARTYGWLLEYSTPVADDAVDTLRFTGWGTSSNANPYVYQETLSEAKKVVSLTQYDNRPDDGTAHFTRAEDMGWHLRGMPYLVSGYHTETVENGRYNMHIPHLLYKMDSEGTYLKSSATYVVKSWLDGEPLNPHEGVFLQTAAIGEVEDLHFRRPIWTGAAPLLAAPRPIVLLRNDNGEGDMLRVEPDEDAPKQLAYMYGRDGVKWLMPDAPQMYLLTEGLARMSLAGAAPTEVDLPLGIRIPDNPTNMNGSIVHFSLPEPEAFDGYDHVWLIDRALNRVTNLLENDYTTSIYAGTDHSRFRLRIGGMPFGDASKREYIVFAFGCQLFIRGLIEGDHIIVYSATGQRVLDTFASDPEFTAELPQAGGVYAVRVNDFSTKVRNL